MFAGNDKLSLLGFVAVGRPSYRVDFNHRVIEWVEPWALREKRTFARKDRKDN
jgi:hypothetical protein